MRYRFRGLIFGGAYTWRGLFSEFYGNSINKYGNSNATRAYFGGKSHSNPRLVSERQLKKRFLKTVTRNLNLVMRNAQPGKG